jgi:hypothetical protein
LNASISFALGWYLGLPSFSGFFDFIHFAFHICALLDLQPKHVF